MVDLLRRRWVGEGVAGLGRRAEDVVRSLERLVDDGDVVALGTHAQTTDAVHQSTQNDTTLQQQQQQQQQRRQQRQQQKASKGAKKSKFGLKNQIKSKEAMRVEFRGMRGHQVCP